jgi:hypothetical protein
VAYKNKSDEIAKQKELRRGRKSIHGLVHNELYVAFHDLARRKNVSVRQLLTEAIAAILEDHCEPVPEATKRDIATGHGTYRRGRPTKVQVAARPTQGD